MIQLTGMDRCIADDIYVDSEEICAIYTVGMAVSKVCIVLKNGKEFVIAQNIQEVFDIICVHKPCPAAERP